MKWKRKLNENKLINCDYKLLKLKRTEKTVLYKKKPEKDEDVKRNTIN